MRHLEGAEQGIEGKWVRSDKGLGAFVERFSCTPF